MGPGPADGSQFAGLCQAHVVGREHAVAVETALEHGEVAIGLRVGEEALFARRLDVRGGANGKLGVGGDGERMRLDYKSWMGSMRRTVRASRACSSAVSGAFSSCLASAAAVVESAGG